MRSPISISTSSPPLPSVLLLLFVVCAVFSVCTVSALDITTRTFSDADCGGVAVTGSINADTNCNSNNTAPHYRVHCSLDGSTFNITYYDSNDATCTGTTIGEILTFQTGTCINSTIKYDCTTPTTSPPTSSSSSSSSSSVDGSSATSTNSTTSPPTTSSPTVDPSSGGSGGSSGNVTNSTSLSGGSSPPSTNNSSSSSSSSIINNNTTSAPSTTTSPPTSNSGTTTSTPTSTGNTTSTPTSTSTSTPTSTPTTPAPGVVVVPAFPLTVRLYATAGCTGDGDSIIDVTNGVCNNGANESHIISCSADGLRATDQTYIGTANNCVANKLTSTRIWSAGICQYNSDTKQYIRIDCPVRESYARNSYPDEASAIGKTVGWAIGTIIGLCLITSLIAYALRGRCAGNSAGSGAGTTTDGTGNVVQMQVLEKNPDGVVPGSSAPANYSEP